MQLLAKVLFNLPWVAWLQALTVLSMQVDVYSFGIVMWELWTGKEPYEGLNYHALLHQITLTNGGLRPPMPNGPKWEGEPLPEPAPGWAGLMERCWHELPEERPGFDEVRLRSVLADWRGFRYIVGC